MLLYLKTSKEMKKKKLDLTFSSEIKGLMILQLRWWCFLMNLQSVIYILNWNLFSNHSLQQTGNNFLSLIYSMHS